MPRREFHLVTEQVAHIAPQVMHFTFTLENAAPFPFIPGQFVTLLLGEPEHPTRRSYSIACAPGGSTVEIAASYVPGGLASELLFHLKPGDKLLATGPFGRLILPPEIRKRYIFVATGTGITPYRAMLPALAEIMATHGSQVIFIQGVRETAELLYADEFVAFAQTHALFSYLPCLSRENPPASMPHALHGRVQAAIETLDLRPGDDLFYLCGNPDMIDQTFEHLTARGFPTPDIKREKYISSK